MRKIAIYGKGGIGKSTTTSKGYTLLRRENYIHMIDPESVKMQIEAVYEPHYQYFKEYFGNTFAFFRMSPVWAMASSIRLSPIPASSICALVCRDWRCPGASPCLKTWTRPDMVRRQHILLLSGIPIPACRRSCAITTWIRWRCYTGIPSAASRGLVPGASGAIHRSYHYRGDLPIWS